MACVEWNFGDLLSTFTRNQIENIMAPDGFHPAFEACDAFMGDPVADAFMALSTTMSSSRRRGGDDNYADAGLISDAQTNQQGAARFAALGATNESSSQVLNTARGQGQVAMGSMEKLSNIDTAKGLAKLRDQQTIAAAKNQALGEVAGAARRSARLGRP